MRSEIGEHRNPSPVLGPGLIRVFGGKKRLNLSFHFQIGKAIFVERSLLEYLIEVSIIFVDRSLTADLP